jgi:hypothetical protein
MLPSESVPYPKSCLVGALKKVDHSSPLPVDQLGDKTRGWRRVIGRCGVIKSIGGGGAVTV